jgi:hypothetical protein
MKTVKLSLPALAFVFAIVSAFASGGTKTFVAPDFVKPGTACTQISLSCTPVDEAPICQYKYDGTNYTNVFESRLNPSTCSTPALRHNSADGKLN